MLGKIEGKRRRGQPRMRWFDGITNSMDMNLGELWEKVKDREAWVCCNSDMTWQLNNSNNKLVQSSFFSCCKDWVGHPAEIPNILNLPGVMSFNVFLRVFQNWYLALEAQLFGKACCLNAALVNISCTE